MASILNNQLKRLVDFQQYMWAIPVLMSVYGEERREAQGRILQRKLLKTIMAVLSQVSPHA